MSGDEDRALFEHGGVATTVVVATETGVVTVDVAGDRVGGFGLAHRCRARDVTADGDRLVVATAADVLTGSPDALTETGFGPATTVGTNGSVVAAGEDGRIATDADGEWRRLGTLSTIHDIQDGFLAAADGIHRVEPGLPHVGLDDANTVTGYPVPRAGTDTGLYRLGNGWIAEHDGVTTVLASDQGRDDCHAVIDGRLHQYVDDGWHPITHPATGSIVDLAYGEAVYAVTIDGTLLVGDGSEWRTHPLGVQGVGGLTTWPE